jgi:peptidyl-prolyl isomerase E (cyclophilin E)
MAANPKRFIYVGGLDMQVDAPTLNAAFIPFGEIVDVQIPLDLNTSMHFFIIFLNVCSHLTFFS